MRVQTDLQEVALRQEAWTALCIRIDELVFFQKETRVIQSKTRSTFEKRVQVLSSESILHRNMGDN